jgi:uncharacterized protein (TIGR02678 family)
LQFTLEERSERRDLVAVVRLLLELGLLSRVTGDEVAFIHAQEKDVLYDVNRRLLSALLAVSRGPSLIHNELDETTDPSALLQQRITAITETFVPDTPDARNTALRRRLTARLLDDPILYWDELNAEELTYLNSQRPHITRRIQDATGLISEVRKEGMAMIDPNGDLSDMRLPSEGTEGHATLLLADHLAAHRLPQSFDSLHQQMRLWIKEYRRYWKKAVHEKGAEVELCNQALQRLQALRLVEIEGHQVRPLPAIGRHVLGETSVISKKTKQVASGTINQP